MASWKKVIVSGSNAELNSVTASLHFFVDGPIGEELAANYQTISSSPSQTWLTGSFSGDGSRLTNVTGSKVNVTNCTDTATNARIVFTAAGSGTQALCSSTGLTYNVTSDTIAANISGNAATATTATTATSASNVTLTACVDGAQQYKIPFFVSGAGTYPALTHTITYRPDTDSLTVSNITGSVSNATCATCIKLTETDNNAAYNLVFATSGAYADARIDNTLTYNAQSNLLTTGGDVVVGKGNVAGTLCSNGAYDLILQTGGTASCITLEQGANQPITLAPNGTGVVKIGGGKTITTTDSDLTLGDGVINVCVANSLNVGDDLTVAGDLIVNGNLAYLNVTNLAVEDRFILLNSGSAGDDYAGIVVDEGNPSGSGHALVYTSGSGRWGFTGSLASNATTVIPDAFAAAVVTSDIPEYQKVGNIRLSGEDIYIYS